MSRDQRLVQVYDQHYRELASRIDRMFGFLLLIEWLAGIAFAWWVSPQTWIGDRSQVHLHVYAAILLGGLNAAFPAYLAFRSPGESINRYVIAVAQMMFSALFIHLTGGRIETHFHVFGSLAFLAFYRDVRVLGLATALTASDHLLRGLLWPQSVYGVLTATPWRAIEHAGWVVFEDAILFLSITDGLKQLRSVCEHQTRLEETIQGIERTVEERTRELVVTQATIARQQEALALSAKLSALGEMAGGVAHEINNPLAVIRNCSGQIEELIAEAPIDVAAVTGIAGKLVKTTDRIAKIVQGLRIFSRDASDDPWQTVALSGLVEDTLGLCRERFKSHGIQLDVEVVECRFDGRGIELSQVLLNLLNNAHDAIEGTPVPWVRVDARPAGDRVEIRVTDSGRGISVALAAKLFQPFFTTKPVGKGTGLGLSIALGIMRKHRGDLRVDDACANTTFVLSLPQEQPRGTAADAA